MNDKTKILVFGITAIVLALIAIVISVVAGQKIATSGGFVMDELYGFRLYSTAYGQDTFFTNGDEVTLKVRKFCVQTTDHFESPAPGTIKGRCWEYIDGQENTYNLYW